MKMESYLDKFPKCLVIATSFSKGLKGKIIAVHITGLPIK